MQCPKCHGYMKPIAFKDVEVDRCIKCYGLWFDEFELEDIKQLAGSEIIDIGDADEGQEHDRKKFITCPKCNVTMTTMHDLKQSHITYEQCEKCGGIYFDAGEFKDLKQFTPLEKIKYFLKKLS